MRKLWNKVLALALGAALLTGYVMTGKTGLSSSDQKIYQEAAALQTQVDSLGFKDFKLADYPVAMNDGKNEYVIYKDKITKRKPVLQTFAGTAYPVKDHYEVLVPTMEKFDRLMSLTGGVETMAAGSGYDAAQQKAVIWHEAFHAYQLTHYALLGEKITPQEQLAEIQKMQDNPGGESEDSVIRKAVDDVPGIRTMLEAENTLLKKAVAAEGIDELKALILQYNTDHGERLSKMPQEAVRAEQRCELTEGTARYVEAMVYRRMRGQKAYGKRYLNLFSSYEKGRGKYYETGMAKCLILDKLYPDWKGSFDFSSGLQLGEYL